MGGLPRAGIIIFLVEKKFLSLYRGVFHPLTRVWVLCEREEGILRVDIIISRFLKNFLSLPKGALHFFTGDVALVWYPYGVHTSCKREGDYFNRTY